MRRLSHFCLVFLFLVCLSVALGGENFTLRDSQKYRIHYQIDIQNTNYPVLDYNLQFPIFLTQNLPPYQQLVSFKVIPDRLKIEDNQGVLWAVYSAERIEPNQRIRLELFYTFVNSAINYKLPSIELDPDLESGYLKPENGIESNDKRIIALVNRVISNDMNPLERSKKLFEYVNRTLNYQPNSDQPHSALRTLQRREGSCEDYSLLYIALCRAAGIPARFISGYRFKPQQIGRKEIDLDQFAHAWVEIQLPGTGWITVDPTFTYTLNGTKTVNYDFFGAIQTDDRHLFFNYSRQIERSIRWNYVSNKPPKVTTDFRILISRP